MTEPGARPSAELVGGLAARTPAGLAFLVLARAGGGLLRAPAFLQQGALLSLDDDFRIVERGSFGGWEAAAGGDLADLVAAVAAEGTAPVLFTRNRFLLPRLAERKPDALTAARAVMVQGPGNDDARLGQPELAALLAPFGLEAAETVWAANSAHFLFERGTWEAPPEAGVAGLRLEDGYVVGEVAIGAAAAADRQVTLFAGAVPVGIGSAIDTDRPGRCRFRIWAAPELLSAGTDLSVVLTRFGDRQEIGRLARPVARRFVPDAILGAHRPAAALRRPLGVLLLGSGDDPATRGALHSLARQGAQDITQLRLDGPGGPAADRLAEEALELGFTDLVRHHGRVGPDKLAIQGLWHMAQAFARVIVVCGPVEVDVRRLEAALDGAGAPDPLVGDLSGGAWAAEGDRLAPFLRQLAFLFSLEERDYRAWSCEEGGPAAAGFAWKEALVRLIARAGPDAASVEPLP